MSELRHDGEADRCRVFRLRHQAVILSQHRHLWTAEPQIDCGERGNLGSRHRDDHLDRNGRVARKITASTVRMLPGRADERHGHGLANGNGRKVHKRTVAYSSGVRVWARGLTECSAWEGLYVGTSSHSLYSL